MTRAWDGEDLLGPVDRDEDEHARWLYRWTRPCPDRRPQLPRVCLGHREREPGRLQLRVALCRAEGVCNVIVEEDDDTVRVRLIICCDEDLFEDDREREYMDCPVHVYLDKPLGGRTVIDVQTDQPVPLFVPDWAEPGQTGVSG